MYREASPHLGRSHQMAAANTFKGGGGGGRPGGGGGGGGGRHDRGGGTGSRLPPEILARLSRRKRNPRVVSLDFKVPNVPSLPTEEEIWDWLESQHLIEDESHEVEYFEREIIEKKIFVCMKEETGADWLAEKFEEGLKFKVPQGHDVLIKAKKECEKWYELVVRGVFPNTEITDVENVFKQFGDVKEVAFVTFGQKKIKCNKITLKLKVREGSSIPSFVMAPTGVGEMERWEVIKNRAGALRVCFQCYQPGHPWKLCPNQAPTIAEVQQGKAGTAVSYAQALAGTNASKPPMTPRQVSLTPQTPLRITLENPGARHTENSLARRTNIQDPARQENGPVTPGPISGETVNNSLISPDASNNQDPENPTPEANASNVNTTPAKTTDAPASSTGKSNTTENTVDTSKPDTAAAAAPKATAEKSNTTGNAVDASKLDAAAAAPKASAEKSNTTGNAVDASKLDAADAPAVVVGSREDPKATGDAVGDPSKADDATPTATPAASETSREGSAVRKRKEREEEDECQDKDREETSSSSGDKRKGSTSNNDKKKKEDDLRSPRSHKKQSPKKREKPKEHSARRHGGSN